MNKKLLCFLLGRAAPMIGAAQLFPLIYAFFDREPCRYILFWPPLIAFAVGAALLVYGRKHKERVLIPEAALFILLLWWLSILLGMLPYALTGWLAPTDALFQAAADCSTTGIILLPPEAPFSLYLWHTILGWIGGAIFLTMLVTMIPLAGGCFGLMLSFRRGLVFSTMVGQTDELAKQVMGVYLWLTAFAAIIYMGMGLNPSEAIILSMLSVSTTGGDTSYFMSEPFFPALKFAIALVLFLTCGNFLRYWRTFRRRDWRDYYSNREIRSFTLIIVVLMIIMFIHLIITDIYNVFTNFHYVVFYALSFASTAGFVDAETMTWPDLELFLLLFMALVGGCIGSPTGGLKAIRFITLWKLIGAEIKRTLHPHMMSGIVIGGEAVPADVCGRMLAFFFLYTCAIFAYILMLTAAGGSLSESVGLAVSSFTGLGAMNGLYSLETIIGLPAWAKIGSSFFMILGRMEIFAFLVLVEHVRWQRDKKW